MRAIAIRSGFRLSFQALVALLAGCVTAGVERVDGPQGIEGTFGLLPKVESKLLHVCLNTNHPRALEGVRDAILDWVDSLRGNSTVPLVTDVREGCPGDFRVNFFSTSRAHTFPAPYPVMNLGAPGDYPSLLHETGHALGLGDSYVEGMWKCEGVNADSVMCSPGLEELSEVDRDGLRAVWREYKSRPVFVLGSRKFRCPDRMRLYGVGNWIFCARGPG